MDKKYDNIDDDMSKTFISEVGQKSAVAGEDTISLEDVKDEINKISDTQVDSAKEEIGEEQIIKKQNPIQNNNNPKKRNPIITVFLMLLCLAVGAGATYYYFEVYNTKEESTSLKKDVKEKTEKQEELNPNGIFVQNLIERYDIYVLFEHELYQVLYSRDMISTRDFDQNVVAILAAKDARIKTGEISADRFSKEDFQRSVVKLFGTDMNIPDQDIKYNPEETTFTYDTATGYYQYKQPEGLGGTTTYSFERKTLKAIKDKDTLKITVAIALLDSSTKKVYKKCTETKDGMKVTDEVEDVTTETFDIDKDYSKLNQYKYTFNYDSENNNYYLERIELMK